MKKKQDKFFNTYSHQAFLKLSYRQYSDLARHWFVLLGTMTKAVTMHDKTFKQSLQPSVEQQDWFSSFTISHQISFMNVTGLQYQMLYIDSGFTPSKIHWHGTEILFNRYIMVIIVTVTQYVLQLTYVWPSLWWRWSVSCYSIPPHPTKKKTACTIEKINFRPRASIIFIALIKLETGKMVAIKQTKC